MFIHPPQSLQSAFGIQTFADSAMSPCEVLKAGNARERWCHIGGVALPNPHLHLDD
jgi:hypothetical protein